MTRHRPSEDYNTAREEYYFLQSEVSQYDQRCLSIKGWSITVSFALIALAFAEDVPALFDRIRLRIICLLDVGGDLEEIPAAAYQPDQSG